MQLSFETRRILRGLHEKHGCFDCVYAHRSALRDDGPCCEFKGTLGVPTHIDVGFDGRCVHREKIKECVDV